MNKFLLVLMLTGFLASCADLDTADGQDIPDRIATVEAGIAKPLVAKRKGRYVSLAPLRTSEGLQYQHMPVSVQAADLPLELVLDHILKSLPRSQRPTLAVSRDVDLKTPISLTLDSTFAGVMAAIDEQAEVWSDLGSETIKVQSWVSASFKVAAFAGESSFQIGQNASGGAVGGTDGAKEANTGSRLHKNSQYASTTSKGGFWEGIKATVEAILTENSKKKGLVTVQPTVARINVSGHARNVRAVKKYIESLNGDLSRQIVLEIQLLSVVMDDETTVGIDWEAVRTTGNSLTRVATETVKSAYGGTTQLPTFSLNHLSGKWSSSGAMIKALRQQGKVYVETTPRVVTLNNQAAELQLTDKTNYLAETSIGFSSNGQDAQAGLVPGVVTDGFSFYVLPRVFEEDIYLHISVTLSKLQGIDTVESGNQSIQTPRITENIFNQRARIKNGHTLVIGGIKQRSFKRLKDAVPGVNWLGTQHKAEATTEIVMLITPRIL